jgi:hypothetical protein
MFYNNKNRRCYLSPGKITWGGNMGRWLGMLILDEYRMKPHRDNMG